MSFASFTPQSIPSLFGRVYFITGGTAGLGAGTISLLAQHTPAHIYFSGRNAKNAQSVIDKAKATNPDVPVTFIECDLANLMSVKKAAERFLAQAERLDVLYANAGIMAFPPGTTTGGYEIQFVTNHMGHAFLIKLLLPLMQRTAEQLNSDVRMILSSSVVYKQAPKEGIAFDTVKSPQDNLGGPREALPVKVMAAGHWTSVEEGPCNQVWAGTTKRENLEDGAYYVPIARKGALETAAAKDAKLADMLWDWTEQELASFV